jgi:RHS repeat-associated protein
MRGAVLSTAPRCLYSTSVSNQVDAGSRERYDLEVQASGSSCTAFVDGVQIGGTQTITAHQTDTYHGLYVFQSTDHLFENFSVLAEADAEAVGWLGDPGYVTEAAVMRRLEYVRARWYQAGGPGWLSLDPIGLGGGDVNLYRYVANSPLTVRDPSGLDWLDSTTNLSAGWGDTLSGGLIGIIRRLLGVDQVVDRSSGAYVAGQIIGSVHAVCLSGAAVLRPGTAAEQVVTHWNTPETISPGTIRPGSWVMTGGATRRNFVFAGVWRRYPYAQRITTTVPRSALKWPSGGLERWKGLIGQRIYSP